MIPTENAAFNTEARIIPMTAIWDTQVTSQEPSPVSGQSELVLTLYRVYDPNLCRWLSCDPIGEEGGLNSYGYVVNDPLRKIDPLGLWDWNPDKDQPLK